MLDLETLGTTPGSAIIAIGAVKFGASEIHSEFYQRVDIKSCVAAGLTMDPDTVMWWLQQPDEARLEITKEGQVLPSVLQFFYEWCYTAHRDTQEIEMWGNGASFDNTLLAVAYSKFGLRPPVEVLE